jgi:prevent-host-death family protein
MNSSQKGAIAETAIALAATRLGIGVSRPLQEQLAYDLVFDLGPNLLRVQCKCATRKGDVAVVPVRRTYFSPTRGYVRGTYSADEVDAVAAYCEELDRCYLIPIDRLGGKGFVHLRLEPARNNQSASINWAADYELGAVAQLEERVAGSDEVVGSSPTSSIPGSLKNEVGMDEFDARLAHYVRHVEAGNEVLITRWGRPVARLVPSCLAAAVSAD